MSQINDYSLMLKYNLSFFDGGDGGEKTEQPTARKREKAREEGQVARSAEIGTAVLFLAVFFGLRYFAPWMYNSLKSIFQSSFNILANVEDMMGIDYTTKYLTNMFMQCIIISSPVLLVSMGSGLVVNLVQVRWKPTTKPLMPKFSKLNPVSGFKRLFSMQILVDLIKSLVKIFIIGYMIYSVLMNEMQNIFLLIDMELTQAMAYIGGIVTDLGIRVGFLYLFIAVADYAYQRYKHTKSLKMTKQEIKEEYKMVEGNPQIKGKIRQKMREASMRRMMQEVPGADVIITNPTHYAVAIKYEKGSAAAPAVIAKGVDFLAMKIKEKAKENNVEIVENKQLARTLYNTVDVGREIPAELYQAVAEILAFVYKLKEKA